MDFLICGYHPLFFVFFPPAQHRHVSRDSTYVQLKHVVVRFTQANASVCFNVLVGLLLVTPVLSWHFHYDGMWQFPVYEGHYSLFDVNTFATDCCRVTPFLQIPT